MDRAHLSIIIPTKNRKEDLINCINSIMRQSYLPDEIVIIDQSVTKDDKDKIITEILSERVRLIYIYDPGIPGTAHARNMGVENSTGGILLFLDDDTILLESAIHNLMGLFSRDSEKVIGAIGLAIINAKSDLRAYLGELIFCHGPFKLFFHFTYFHNNFETISEELFPCRLIGTCACGYRREVFDTFKFESGYVGLSYSDDLILSFRVSERFKTYYTNLARVEHDKLQRNRKKNSVVQKWNAFINFYLFYGFVKKTPYSAMCYCLLVIKDFLKILVNLNDISVAKGILYSYASIIKIIFRKASLEECIKDIFK